MITSAGEPMPAIGTAGSDNWAESNAYICIVIVFVIITIPARHSIIHRLLNCICDMACKSCKSPYASTQYTIAFSMRRVTPVDVIKKSRKVLKLALTAGVPEGGGDLL